MPTYGLPTSLPIPLPGSLYGVPGAASDVRPIAQWVEPARSGVGMEVTVLTLTVPGFYFDASAATGSLTSLWLRREGGDDTEVLSGTLYLNLADTGHTVSIGAGETEASGALGIDLEAGDDVRVLMTGDNTAVVSGVLRTPSRLFRLTSAPLGKVWVLTEDGWVAPPLAYVKDAGAWVQTTGEAVRDEGAWVTVL